MALPVAANNEGFLGLYFDVSKEERHEIEHKIWNEAGRPVGHDFGREYIKNLSQASYSRLSEELKNEIDIKVYSIAHNAPGAAAVMRAFVNALLPA